MKRDVPKMASQPDAKKGGCGGAEYPLNFEPVESRSSFGGNSHWRGPVWFPMNVLLLRALRQSYLFHGDGFTMEYPAASGVRHMSAPPNTGSIRPWRKIAINRVASSSLISRVTTELRRCLLPGSLMHDVQERAGLDG
jgi:hypothetical protein